MEDQFSDFMNTESYDYENVSTNLLKNKSVKFI